MVYGLIHYAVAAACVGALQRDLARGYVLDDDDQQVPTGSLSFGVSAVVQLGIALYCVVMGTRALLCI